MFDEQGPRRLRQGNDTPPALLRAIDALRKGVDDGARLARVGKKLEGVLNAPPTAAGTAAAATAASAAQRGGLLGQKLSMFKLILGGLALCVVLAPLFFRQHSDDGRVPAADRDGSSGATTSAAELAAAPQPQTNQQAEATPPAERSELENTAVPVVKSAEPSQPPQRSSKHATRTHERSRREAPAELASSDEPAAKNSAAAQNHDAAKPAHGTAPSAAANELPQAPEAPQRTGEKLQLPEDAPPAPAEADLLLKARKALKTDPSLALRLAAEHQSYYPKGRLVPEREVLAIEALRNLGRKPEADARLKKFEARYPKSIHLQRLHDSQ